MSAPQHIITDEFIDELIKRSDAAELLIFECGRHRFRRAIADAVVLYVDKYVSAQRTEEASK